MKYFVMPKDAAGQIAVISEREGIPVNMEGVKTVELPKNNGGFFVISKNKEYPVNAVARAVAYGQITLDDLRAAE